MKGEQSREHFRVSYPLTEAAKFEARSGSFAIIDVSQEGIKINTVIKGAPQIFKNGDSLAGQIHFLCGERIKIQGKILRVGPNYAVARLDESIPLKIMYDEHRYVINKTGAK